jgi:hypothetical protein
MCRLIDLVNVRALLAIDLDIHVELVHQQCRRLVFEGLVRHHVAPVTGRVSDRQEYRFAGVSREPECIFAPRIPVDWITRMLQKIGAGFGRQLVFVFCRSAHYIDVFLRVATITHCAIPADLLPSPFVAAVLD